MLPQERGVPRQTGQHNRRRGLSKDDLARIADETIKAIENGTYSPQALPNEPTVTVDLRINVKNLRAHTTYYDPNSIMAFWTQPLQQSLTASSATGATKIWAVEKSTLATSHWLVQRLASKSQPTSTTPTGNSGPRSHAVGVLNFASARNPGGGFLTGSRAQEESIARSSTLYYSLTCPIGRQFYDDHNSMIANNKNDGYYSHAMIYSPSVMVIRDDTGDWVHPFEIDVLTSPAVNAGVVRQKRQQAIDRGQQLSYSEVDMETRIRNTMKERMARLLYLFETQGVKNLVLGSFGTGVFKNSVDMVVDLWAELLLGQSSRFAQSFERVVFGVIDNETFTKFAQRFGTGA